MIGKNGQVTAVFLLLVIGVIGVAVLSEFTTGFCNCAKDVKSETLLNDTAVDFNCLGEICEIHYLYCDGDYLTQEHLAIPGEYTRDGCEITLTDDTYDGIECQLGYTYQTDLYNDGIMGMIVCLLPVFIALALLMIATGWFVLK